MSDNSKMRVARIYKAMIIALFLGFALPAMAQDAVPPPAEHSFDREAFKQRLLEKVIEVKHEKLRETLLLDDETAKKFFAIYDPAEKAMIALVKDRQEQELKLLKLLQGDNKDAEVDQTLQNIKALNQKLLAETEQLDNNLKPVLNPRQRAKLLAFEQKFNRIAREKVRDRIQEWKENHPGQHPFHRKTGVKPPKPGVK